MASNEITQSFLIVAASPIIDRDDPLKEPQPWWTAR